MFEDVFEPLDDIIDGAKEASDEWGDVWDTGEKEDMWRADPKDVWTIAPANQPVPPAPAPQAPQPKPDPIISPPGPMNNTPEECEKEECEKESCPECDQGSGLFDDLFLDIF